MESGFGRAALIAVLLTIPAAATAQPATGGELAEMMRTLGGPGLKGKKLEKAIEAARAYPLGSDKNPVRASTPIGQREYLARLRCADGTAPSFDRVGNVGTGIYGYIVDDYAVQCEGQDPVNVYMDMYHDHVEQQPVPGFTIVAPGGVVPTA